MGAEGWPLPAKTARKPELASGPTREGASTWSVGLFVLGEDDEGGCTWLDVEVRDDGRGDACADPVGWYLGEPTELTNDQRGFCEDAVRRAIRREAQI